jgi:glycine C-acetyltransferase
LVITEGVFGMAGDMGRLKEIVELKKQYNFRLLIDDAHGFGTMGPTGAGAAEAQGVQDEVDIYFSTFAKAMASVGAFVASKENIIEYLRYNTRSQIFAKTLPMPLVVGNMKRLELLRTKPELREKLWTVVNALQKGLREKGFEIGKTESPVTPVYLSGTEMEAAQMIIDLRENYGIFCSIVIYPVVPKGVMMLRLIPTAEHTLEDVDRTIKAFSEIAVKLKEGVYSKGMPNI